MLWPWPVWLSWLEHHPINKRLQVQFPVGAHAWVAGLIPSQGTMILIPICACVGGNQLMLLSLIDVSLSLPLSLKAMKKKMSSGEYKNIYNCYENGIVFIFFKSITCPGQVIRLAGGLPTNPPKVAGSIPCKGTHPGCGFDLHCWACRRQLINVSQIDVSFSLSLPLFLSHNPPQVNKHILQGEF